MRLSEREKIAIVESICHVDPSAEIWLFGSRVRDDLKGGDIDLLVISSLLELRNKVDILVEIKMRIGEQKIDLHIVKPDLRDVDPLAKSVLPNAIRLR